MRHGVPFRAFFVTVFVAAITLLVLALISLNAHEKAMRTLVAERDRRSVEALSLLLSDRLKEEGAQSAAIFAQTFVHILPSDGASALFIIDQVGNLVYQQGDLHTSASLPRHIGVAEGLRGGRGVAFTPASDGEHIVAYAPIAQTDWLLIIEEPWQQPLSRRLRTTLIAPMTLIPLVVIMLGALWFGGRQIVNPLQQLTRQATKLGEGQHDALYEAVGGISEIRLLQSQLQSMAEKVAQAQHSMRQYASAVTLGQEEERHRLARELHDGAIQTLTVIHQDVKLAQWDNPEGEIGEMLTHIEDLITTLSAELRDMIRALRPSYLEELGLVATLETLIKQNSIAWSLPIQFNLAGKQARLEPNIELALCRIAQEALNNVHRHAHASQVHLTLTFAPEQITLTVIDDGHGFDRQHALTEYAASGHFGLIGAYERTKQLGGVFSLTSNPAEGTNLSVVFPRHTQTPPVPGDKLSGA